MRISDFNDIEPDPDGKRRIHVRSGKGGETRRPTAAPREPREPSPPIPRLGDRIEAALQSVGVTPERWQQAKAAIGLPATCRCQARKAWLNRLDEHLGLGEKLAAFRAALRW